MNKLLFVGVLAVGCGGGRGVAGSTIAYREPPAAKVEEVKPRAGFVWVKGHWYDNKKDWKWIDGHYEPERPGYTWEDGRWEQRGTAWHWIEGHWGTGARAVARAQVEAPKTNPIKPMHPIYPTVAPPPVRVESPGGAPQPDLVWLPGNWEWRAGQWAWINGHWERKHADMIWVRGRWELQGNYYVWIDGRWDKPVRR